MMGQDQAAHGYAAPVPLQKVPTNSHQVLKEHIPNASCVFSIAPASPAGEHQRNDIIANKK
jgi:hypothetical protein